jgi:hypothetical protein
MNMHSESLCIYILHNILRAIAVTGNIITYLCSIMSINNLINPVCRNIYYDINFII